MLPRIADIIQQRNWRLPGESKDRLLYWLAIMITSKIQVKLLQNQKIIHSCAYYIQAPRLLFNVRVTGS